MVVEQWWIDNQNNVRIEAKDEVFIVTGVRRGKKVWFGTGLLETARRLLLNTIR